MPAPMSAFSPSAAGISMTSTSLPSTFTGFTEKRFPVTAPAVNLFVSTLPPVFRGIRSTITHWLGMFVSASMPSLTNTWISAR